MTCEKTAFVYKLHRDLNCFEVFRFSAYSNDCLSVLMPKYVSHIALLSAAFIYIHTFRELLPQFVLRSHVQILSVIA